MSHFWWFLLGSGSATATFMLLWTTSRRHRKGRLLELVSYLEAASIGRESTLTRVEDEFSILEDELYKTVGELRVAREQAQKERLQQADNLADIAHQLKTPLTSMSLMTQLLAEEAAPAQQEYLNRLDSQVSRLGWLTASLLTMSRLDAGAVVFTKAELAFDTLAAGCAEALAGLLAKREQRLTIRGKEEQLVCDAHWTTEALINLIKNAGEHAPPGGEIILCCTETPLYKQIVVEDTGEGFAKEDLPYLFQRFYRGKNAKKDSIGIGLALSLAIVERQGGVLRAENRAEGGARFLIRFYPDVKETIRI